MADAGPADAIPPTDAASLQRDRLVTLGRLTAGIAHELNNPIGYIASNVNTLERYVSTVIGLIDSAAHNMPADVATTWQARLEAARWSFVRNDLPVLLAETRQGTEQLKYVVAELKSLSRQAVAPEHVDIDHCVHAAVTVLTYALKRSATMTLDLAAPTLLSVIRPQMVQLVINLVTNAMEAFGERPRASNVIRISSRVQDNGSVIVIVEDNGPGVPEADRERIFNSFHTTKVHGTGLGLSIVAGIVHAHGGSIRCDASPDLGGGRFTAHIGSWQPDAAQRSS